MKISLHCIENEINLKATTVLFLWESASGILTQKDRQDERNLKLLK